MSYASILLHLDDDPRADDRLAQALHVAHRFEAHLVGLTCRRPAPSYDNGTIGPLGIDTLTLKLAQAQQLARAREAAFLERCEAAQLPSYAALGDDDEAASALVRRGHCSDLLIMGQPEPGDPRRGRRRAVLDEVVLHSARPTLVLPYAGRFDTLGERVLVAWDDSHEAARAIADALPFLCRATQVQLVQFDPGAGESGLIDQRRLDPVLAWLKSHRVVAQGAVHAPRADIGNALLSQAADFSADLLVMGAWGQSRLAERLLGGCTRTVFDSMTLPVLTSH